MKKSITIILSFITACVLLLSVNSCRKNENDVPSPTIPGSGSTINTTLAGRVTDENNIPLANVAVAAYGVVTSTDQHGMFLFKAIDVNKDRSIISFSKQGYFNRVHAFVASAAVNYFKIVLISKANTHTLSSATGGSISLPNGSSIQFQPNSFMTLTGSAYTGTVYIAFKHLSPSSSTFGFSIPGGDLAGKNSAGDDVTLYSYGMFGVELTGSNGDQLQLATGKPATLNMVLAASQMANAPATIPLWYLNESSAVWEEEGQASRVGNKYTGTVTHFSWWNCDYPFPRAGIRGKVVDCNNNPLPNFTVRVDGIYTTVTDNNGVYFNWVPANLSFAVQVLSVDNGGILSSQIENVPALAPNQTFIVPDLITSCPTRVAGTLKTCGGITCAGFVSITDNDNFYNFQYTNDGTFNLLAAPNSTLMMLANDYSFSIYSQTVNTFGSNNVLQIGDILMCDSISINGGNYLKLNGGPYNDLTVYFNEPGSSANLHTLGSPYLTIYQTGFTPALPGYDFHALLPDTIPGTYFLTDSATSHLNAGWMVYYTPGIQVQLTEFGKVGERVKGTYFGVGTTTIYQPGNSIIAPVEITGSFDVKRRN